PPFRSCRARPTPRCELDKFPAHTPSAPHIQFPSRARREGPQALYIRSLELRDFRSWPELKVELEPGITIFIGRNGFGKTNIVEAIGYLAHLSSHRVSADAPLVRANATCSRISAVAVNQGRELAAHLLIKPHAANQGQINRTRVKSPRELLGVIKTVLFAPEDLALVRGEPAERRRYLD